MSRNEASLVALQPPIKTKQVVAQKRVQSGEPQPAMVVTKQQQPMKLVTAGSWQQQLVLQSVKLPVSLNQSPAGKNYQFRHVIYNEKQPSAVADSEQQQQQQGQGRTLQTQESSTNRKDLKSDQKLRAFNQTVKQSQSLQSQLLSKRLSNPELNELVNQRFQNLQAQLEGSSQSQKQQSQFSAFQRYSSQHNPCHKPTLSQNLSQHQVVKLTFDHKKSMTQLTEPSLSQSPLNKKRGLISNKLSQMIGKQQSQQQQASDDHKKLLHFNSQPCINININQVSINNLFLNGQMQKLQESKQSSVKNSPLKQNSAKTVENYYQTNYYHNKTQAIKKASSNSNSNKTTSSSIKISALLSNQIKAKASVQGDFKTGIRSFNKPK